MKRKGFIIGLAALLVVGAISSIAFSQGFGRRGRGFGPPGLGYGPGMANWAPMGLNLTEEQVEKLQSLQADFDKETLNLRNDIQSKSLELQKLWIADELDEEAILAKAKEVSELQNQLQEKMILHRLDAAKVLTKEQRTQFPPAGYWGRGYQYGHRLPGWGYGGQRGYGHGGRFGMGRGHWNW